jgi:hypothetical protein
MQCGRSGFDDAVAAERVTETEPANWKPLEKRIPLRRDVPAEWARLLQAHRNSALSDSRSEGEMLLPERRSTGPNALP